MSGPAPGPDGFPRFRAVADAGLMVEFGDSIDPEVHGRVLGLDAALAADPFEGFREAVPAYAALLVCFDPLRADHRVARAAVEARLSRVVGAARAPALRDVEVCYDGDLAPDLAAVAEATGLAAEAVVEAHLSGRYSVYMYGFAPGYAYMAGVPAAIQLPRKGAALRGVPAGSVIIAGPQCLVTTITMPTGWWIIGRSPTPILLDDPERPFLFDVGDAVAFRRIDRAAFDARAGGR